MTRSIRRQNSTASRHPPFKINDPACVEELERLSADYIFVVGLSQIAGSRIIRAAKKGVIGFHPTALPRYRGRAAMVWQVLLGVTDAKCTLFFIDEGMDSGPILGQEPYRMSAPNGLVYLTGPTGSGKRITPQTSKKACATP